MIYTVTFNPVLDYVVRMDRFRAGEVNRTASEELQLGGKGINVSTVLRNLGVENVALGFLAGFTGRALEDGLQKNGIQTDFIWLDTGLTRINVKTKGRDETEINGRGPDISGEALEAMFHKLDRLGVGDELVGAGSIPATPPRATRLIHCPPPTAITEPFVMILSLPFRLAERLPIRFCPFTTNVSAFSASQ